MNDKLMILDGNSILFRAFYAMPPLKTKKGQYTNAIYGFLNMLYKLMDDYHPEYICVAFDPKKPTFRHEQYTEYKAGRAKAPNELVEQFSLIREVLKLHNIKCIEIDGYEADDVAGTLANEAGKVGIGSYLVTSDKDYLQLVDDEVKVLLTKKGVTNIKEMDRAAIEEDYGITPEQFVDLKALMGDPSDNIPGVTGVGEKTAIKLIKEYHDLDNMYENIDSIKGKLKEKLEADKMQAYMSQTLSRIITDIPVDLDMEELRVKKVDNETLLKLYDDLEFRNFKKKILSVMEEAGETEVKIEATQKAENNATDANVIYIDDIEKISDIIKETEKTKKLAMKFLYDDDRALYSNAVALGLAPYNGCIYYVDLMELDEKNVLGEFKNILEDENIKKSGHNIKSEIVYLFKNDIHPQGISFDSEVGKYLLNPSESSYAIDKLAYEFMDLELKNINEYLGTGKSKITFRELDKEKKIEYLTNVLHTVVCIEDKIKNEIKYLHMEKLFDTIEMPLVEVLAYMEFEGFKINTTVLDELGEKFTSQLNVLESDITEMAGEKFNIGSPKQLGVILFEKLKLPVIKKTKTGYSTDIEVLEKLKLEHPIVNKIIEYRSLSKLNSTYVEGLKAVVNKDNNRVHSVFNQTITTTGRISSTDPNLQNIPTRSEEGKELRKAFVAEEGYVLVDADYSQIELRVLAHLANEQKLIDAFKHHEDIHTKTASEVFGVDKEEVTSLMRSRAKAVNFGIVYGISDYGLARDLDISRKEAKQYIDNYLKFYDSVDKYMSDIIKQSKKDLYVETYFGRRRYIPELESRNFNIRSFGERVALNTPVQGTAADIIKLAMVNVYNRLKKNNMKSRLLLQVHDELIIEAHKDELEEVKNLLKYEMENVVTDFKVKLEVDTNTGDSWYESK